MKAPRLFILSALPGLTDAAEASLAAVPSAQNVLSTLLGLAFILALIFVGAWLLKRLGHLPTASKGPVRLVGGLSLGTRERLVVVDVDKARLVLGVSPGRVQTLHVMVAPEPFEQALAEAKETAQ
jgi:flagellar protein FliO/FliZ